MLLLTFEILVLLFQPFVLLLQATLFLVTHCFLLIQLLVVAFILDGSVFFEGTPLLLQFIYFFLKTFFVHSVTFALINCFGKFPCKVSDFIGFRLND